MTIRSKFECDGNGCCNEYDIPPYQPADTEVMPDTWICDSVNDFHYCPSCRAKIMASGELEPEHA